MLDRVDDLELRVSHSKGLLNRTVFLIEQTTGRIDQHAARAHQGCRRCQNLRLHLGELCHTRCRLPPLQIRITTQGTGTRARRIDQHPVEFAGQALYTIVAFMRETNRLYVRQTGTRHARPQFCQPLLRNIGGV